MCFFGELGLTGEIRAVSFSEARLREAEKLGFTTFVMPASNQKHLSEIPEKLKKQILWVRELYDLYRLIDATPKAKKSRPSGRGSARDPGRDSARDPGRDSARDEERV